ncbi:MULTISPECIES: hypothetical protein [Stenotrophomonas]|uniref:hypothetical protein n=1 Tax=Stenotrophomonas TaxID=40323 RepID=UPI00131F2334|nr:MULTISPECIES: hypothetical protein [Stenotrophomonas]
MGLRRIAPRAHNRSDQVDLFMRLWDVPLDDAQMRHIGEHAPISQKRSIFGNMNHEGAPYPASSCLASRFHPDFLAVVEPGVRDFLVAIAVDHNLVTYTSCEGHDYRPDGRRPDERHVGLIPRSAEESARAIAVFEAVGRSLNAMPASPAVEVALMLNEVHDGQAVYPTIDLYLSKHADADWDDYFAGVDMATAQLVAALESEQPIA